MVFKHNTQPFADEDSYPSAYNHPRQMDCGGQSLTGLTSFWDLSGEHLISVGEKEVILGHSEGKLRIGGEANIPNHSEAAMSGHTKRSFNEDNPYEGASKRARKVDQSGHVDLSADIVSFSCISDELHDSVVAGEELQNRKIGPLPEWAVKNVPSSNLSLPWFRCTTAEEDTRLESPIRLSSFPGYFEDGHRTTRFNQPEETYLSVYGHRPQKLVPIGRNHQADLPVLRPGGYSSSFGELDDRGSVSADHRSVDEDNSDKWMGTRVMAMPDPNSLALEVRLENNKHDCRCPDEGSIRCTRQHVMEEREKLKKTLGHDRFVELGLYDMGEVVAQNWTEEEEELFHEVVEANPASRGRNFWDVLPRAFPCRSSKQLVSYYFNVFMLRKRAKQNRADPLNVDSDDDEWQDSDDGEFAATQEDDEDSVVECPADSNDVACNNDSHTDTDSDDEADGDDYYDRAIAGEDDGEIYYASGRCISDKSKFTPNIHATNKSSENGTEYQDVHDDSCTSFEGRHSIHSCGSPADFVETQHSPMEFGVYRNDALCISDHEYLADHCDPKIWATDYMHRTEKYVDFLPTSNVIEEFGKDSWE